MCRRSPACTGLGANAPEVLRRTAELIPNQLNSQHPRRYTPEQILDTVDDTDEDRDIHWAPNVTTTGRGRPAAPLVRPSLTTGHISDYRTWTHFPGGGTVSSAIHLAAAGLHGFVVVFVPRAGHESPSAGGNE
jgi:hypothetical protein